MKIIQHGKLIQREIRRVYTCKRCGCIFMPENANEEMRTPDNKDYMAECPDCGLESRDYSAENRVVLEVTGVDLKAYFGREK